MEWEWDLHCYNAWFDQLRLGCHSDSGDINMNSFSQTAFFTLAANVLYGRKLVSLQAVQAVALQWFAWGSLRCKGQNKAENPVSLSSSASLLLLGTSFRSLYSSQPSSLKPCLFSVLSLPSLFTQGPSEPKVFSQRLLEVFRDSLRLDVPWKADPYFSCVQTKPTAHF